MKLKISEIVNILEDEIVWFIEHPDSSLSEDYCKGFIDGLRSAQNYFSPEFDSDIKELILNYWLSKTGHKDKPNK
jgi:hypothetical protein